MDWLHTIWFNVTWPSLRGIGPESLVEIVLGVVVLQKFLSPRIKAWHEKQLAAHHDAIKAHISELMK